MFNKDNSELLGMDYVEDVDEFLYQEQLAIKRMILNGIKSEILKQEVDKAKEKGRKENQKNFIVNAYKENIPVEKIARICKISLAKVNKIIKKCCL